MPALISSRTATWLRSAMSRDTGFGSRQRRIVSSGGGGGGPDVMRAVVQASDSLDVERDGLYTVAITPPGMDGAGPSTIATLALTDVCQGARLPAGTVLLAHRVCVRSIPDGGD